MVPIRGSLSLILSGWRKFKHTSVPLVLHGGTGLPKSDIQRAISCGTAKINVNTENQMVFTSLIRSELSKDKNIYDPRRYLGAAKEAIKEKVKEKMQEFGSSGKRSS